MRVIDFPDHWATGEPVDHIAYTSPCGKMCLFGVMLDDGSNLWALAFPGGHRLARTADAIDWGIEERFYGAPGPELADPVKAAWRDHINLMREAGRGSDRVLQALGMPTVKDIRRSRHDG